MSATLGAPSLMLEIPGSESAKYIAKRVSRAKDRFSLVILSLLLIGILFAVEKIFLSRFEKRIPEMKIDSLAEQQDSLKLSEKLYNLSGEFFNCSDQFEKISKKSNWGIINFIYKKNIDLLEDVACSLEDYAEILVLVSDKDFMSALEREFEAVERNIS